MDDLRARAERLRASLDGLGRAAGASADAAPVAARAERCGVAVTVDTAGAVREVAVAPGWQEHTPSERLGARVAAVLDEAWSRQVPVAFDAAPPAGARTSADGVEVLRALLDRLVGEAGVDMSAPASAPVLTRAATPHVTGRYDGRVALDLDQGWLDRATSAEVSAELTAVLRDLTSGAA